MASVMRIFSMAILVMLVAVCASDEPRERICGLALIRRVQTICHGSVQMPEGDGSKPTKKVLFDECCNEGCTDTFFRKQVKVYCCDRPLSDGASENDQENPPRGTELA